MFPVLSGLSLALACIYDLLWYTVYIFFFFFINYGDSFTNLKVYHYDRAIMVSYCTQLNDSLHHTNTSMHIILTKHVIYLSAWHIAFLFFLFHQLTYCEPICLPHKILHPLFHPLIITIHRRKYCTRIQRTLNFHYFSSFTCGRK